MEISWGFFGVFFFLLLMTLSVSGLSVQRLRAGSGVLCKSQLYGLTPAHVGDL